MAMRERYWNDTENNHVDTEKAYFQKLLQQQGIYECATIEDARYFFFRWCFKKYAETKQVEF